VTLTKIGVFHFLAPRWAAKPLLETISEVLGATFARMNHAPVVRNVEGSPRRTVQRLRGRAFYESIGSPKMIVAPMVDRSEFVGTCVSLLPQHPLTMTAGLANAHKIIP
jgi:hypothetical protein